VCVCVCVCVLCVKGIVLNPTTSRVWILRSRVSAVDLQHMQRIYPHHREAYATRTYRLVATTACMVVVAVMGFGFFDTDQFISMLEIYSTARSTRSSSHFRTRVRDCSGSKFAKSTATYVQSVARHKMHRRPTNPTLREDGRRLDIHINI
jgi:hypothetical protein